MKTRTLYKLTDQNMRTYGGFLWELGKPRETDGRGDLCGPGWLHAYHDPLLAVLLNPIHANFNKPRLFKARGAGGFRDDRGLKCGVTKLTLVEEMPLPAVTTTQRIAFGILCAKRVYKGAAWNAWADAWLSGADRSWGTARLMWASVWCGSSSRGMTWATWGAWGGWGSTPDEASEVAAETAAQAAEASSLASSRKLPLRAIAKQAMKVV